MRYLIFSTLPEAQIRSREEALSRGCDPFAITQYWWPWIAGPQDQAALEIADTDEVEGSVSELPEGWGTA
jgi:hypothetical protein